MNLNELRETISDLNWNINESRQREAILKLVNVEDQYLPFIFSYTHKFEWENYVNVVAQIGFPRNIPMLADLLSLLQDLNWPGAMHAIQILKKIDSNVLIPLLEETIKKAYQEEDFEWLAGLKRLVSECHYEEKVFSSDDIFHLLDFASF